ncbi:MAG: hypothetical protein LBJ89_03195 [Holosporales bacterium]|jgi:hypothetical protein|nr:hypothetical protein [Holosporales bacterium]
MNKFALSYELLTGKDRRLLTDSVLIEAAVLLEKENLVCCFKEDEGTRVQLNLEGIDAWIKNELSKLPVEWKAYKLCVYGIAILEMEPEIIVRKEKTLLMSPSTCFWVQTNEPPRTYGNQDIIVHFADIFCKKINFRKFVERIANNKNVAFVLKWESNGLYLNQKLILTEQSVFQKGIIQILIKRQKENNNEYILFEEIANILQEQYFLEIDDIHNQIYKPINLLQTKARKKVPQLAQRNDFIEIYKNSCRLSGSIWIAD